MVCKLEFISRQIRIVIGLMVCSISSLAQVQGTVSGHTLPDESEVAVKKAFLCDDNWEYFGDNSRDIMQFDSYDDVLENARIMPIQVLMLDKRKFQDYGFGKNISSFYKLDSANRNYMGFLTRRGKAERVMFNSNIKLFTQKIKNNQTGWDSCFVGTPSSQANARKLFVHYAQKSQRFFYDSTFWTYGYFEGTTVFLWSNEKQRFINLKDVLKSELDLAFMKNCFNDTSDKIYVGGCDFVNFFANGRRILGQ